MKNKIIIIILIILAFVFSFLIFKYIPYKQPIAEVHNYECQNEEYENSTYYLQSDKDYYLTSEKIVSTIHYADEYTYRCMVNSYHNNDNISFDDVKKNIYYTQDILNNNENNQEQKNVYEAITFIASQGYTCVEVK